MNGYSDEVLLEEIATTSLWRGESGERVAIAPTIQRFGSFYATVMVRDGHAFLDTPCLRRAPRAPSRETTSTYLNATVGLGHELVWKACDDTGSRRGSSTWGCSLTLNL